MLNRNSVDIFSGKLSKKAVSQTKKNFGPSHFSSPEVRNKDKTNLMSTAEY